MKNIFTKFIGVTFILLSLSTSGFAGFVEENLIVNNEFKSKITYEKGIVKDMKEYKAMTDEVGDLTLAGIYYGEYTKQVLLVKILTGENAGDIIEIENATYNNPFTLDVSLGDKLTLYVAATNGELTYTIIDFWHSDGLMLWSFLFLILVVAIGGKAGLKAVFSLFVSVSIIFGVFIPFIKSGSNPVFVALTISAFIILITHLIITGVGRKSWAAMLGTMGGVLFGTFMMYLVSGSAHLTGLGTSVSQDLASGFPGYDFKGILYAGIILGALGAVMDTGISIASGMNEVKHHRPTISRQKLIKSGFYMGKDILGSMINTLVFAYIGTALVSIMLFSLLDKHSVLDLMNHGFIAEEIVRSLVGSLGLLATIPLTAIISGYLLSATKTPVKQEKNV